MSWRSCTRPSPPPSAPHTTAFFSSTARHTSMCLMLRQVRVHNLFLCICCNKEVFFITGLSPYHTCDSPVGCFDQNRMSAVVGMYRNCGDQGFGSGSGYGYGSAWIRINLSCWIRIRFKLRIRIQGGKNDPQK